MEDSSGVQNQCEPLQTATNEGQPQLLFDFPLSVGDGRMHGGGLHAQAMGAGATSTIAWEDIDIHSSDMKYAPADASVQFSQGFTQNFPLLASGSHYQSAPSNVHQPPQAGVYQAGNFRPPGVGMIHASPGAYQPYGSADMTKGLAGIYSPQSSEPATRHPGEITEADSSSWRCGSSHINRKKRKACGRCGPCQRKNNCEKCMNCINRAKGKQICVFRKCDELKKKPDSTCAAPEDAQFMAPQEKRKGTGRVLSAEGKRSRTEESVTSSIAASDSLLRPAQKFPVHTPFSHQLNFDSSPPPQHTTALPNTLPHLKPPIELAVGPSRGHLADNRGTTDVISQALRQIDHPVESNTFCGAELGLPPNNGSVSAKKEREEDFLGQNLLSQKAHTPLQWSSDLAASAPPANVNFSPQSTPLDGFPNGRNASITSTIPEQILRNPTTQFNEFASLQENIGAPGNSAHTTLPANYADACFSELDHQTVSPNDTKVGSTASRSSEPRLLSITKGPEPTPSDVDRFEGHAKEMYHHGHNASNLRLPNCSSAPVNPGILPSATQGISPHAMPSAYNEFGSNIGAPNPYGYLGQPPSMVQKHAQQEPGHSHLPFGSPGGHIQVGRHQGQHYPYTSNNPLCENKEFPSYFPSTSSQLVNHPAGAGGFPQQPWNGRSAAWQGVPMQGVSNAMQFHGNGLFGNAGQPAGYPPASGKPFEYARQQQPGSANVVGAGEQGPAFPPHSNFLSQAPYHPYPASSIGEVQPSPSAQNVGNLPKSHPHPFMMDTLNRPHGMGMQEKNPEIGQESKTWNSEKTTPAANSNYVATSSSEMSTDAKASTSDVMSPSTQYYGQAKGSSDASDASSLANAAAEAGVTISPGESGYDSNEVPHVVEDLQEEPQNHEVVTASYEAKKVMTDDSQSQEVFEKQKGNHVSSKNLHRAPADHKVVPVHESADQISVTKLPSAGACDNNADRTRSALFSRTAEPFSVRNQRSTSHDCSVYKLSSEEEEKLPVKLRRYSLQEHCSAGGARTPEISFRHGSPDATCDTSSVASSRPEKSDVMSPDGLKTPHRQGSSWSSEQSPSSTVSSKGAGMPFCSGRVLPFDTPPVTPRSGDPATTKGLDFQFFGSSVNGTGCFSNILPTPPHHDTAAPQNTASSHGVESRAGESIPTVATPERDYGRLPQKEENAASLRGNKVFNDGSKKTPPRTQFPKCTCIEGTDGTNDDAPYYTHLGAAESIMGIRKLFEERTGYSGPAIRIEKVSYTGKEGKTSRGCPIAKWIIRRSNEEEKVLLVCRQRPRHHCSTAVIVVIILLWDGVARPLADFAYANYSTLVPKHGEPTERRCGTNDERTCACQGFDEATCGASFSFGCSWSMYYNGCKYARSHQPNKYKLTGTKDAEAENFIGMLCERLATVMSPLYQMAAPDAFSNQVQYEDEGFECRLGKNTTKNSRPFSGVTTCLDFCAHAHKDQHNMDNGSTVVVTFTKPELRTIGYRPEDEQLHVLPLYKLDVDEHGGNFQSVNERIASGAIEVLRGFRREVRVLKTPKLTKKQKMKARKKSTIDDGDGFRLCGRRGRPPKRARSFENLTRECAASPCGKLGLSPGRWSAASQARLRMETLPDQQGQHNKDSFPNAPTLWPYRRQLPLPPAPSSVAVGPQLPCPSPKEQGKESIVPTFSIDHLPSIGSFFQENQGGEQPPGPGRVPSPNPHNFMAGDICGVTPLPSINDVVAHPFHRTFAAVKNEPVDGSGRTQYADGSVCVGSTHSEPSAVADRPPGNCKEEPGSASFLRNAADNNAHPPVQPAPHSFDSMQYDVYSDSEENFRDTEIGGVAVAPGHGSVLIECAKKELHATTPLLRPDRFHPSRISLVFYQHKSLNSRNHGAAEYGAKEEKRQKLREEKKLGEAMRNQELEAQLLRKQEMEARSMFANSPAHLMPRHDGFPTSDRLPGMMNDPFRRVNANPSPDPNVFRDARKELYGGRSPGPRHAVIPKQEIIGCGQQAWQQSHPAFSQQRQGEHTRMPPAHPSPQVLGLVRSHIAARNVLREGAYDGSFPARSVSDRLAPPQPTGFEGLYRPAVSVPASYMYNPTLNEAGPNSKLQVAGSHKPEIPNMYNHHRPQLPISTGVSSFLTRPAALFQGYQTTNQPFVSQSFFPPFTPCSTPRLPHLFQQNPQRAPGPRQPEPFLGGWSHYHGKPPTQRDAE